MSQPQPQQPGYPPNGPPPPPAYAQPPPGYGQPIQGSTTVVLTPPVIAVAQGYRESPVRTKCPHCNADVVTATSYTTGTFTWIICLILCFVGCDLGCCLIPFCVNSCKDCVHKCPNCHQQLGIYRRM
ncbi:LITAF domain-containing protein-like [Liolophura sinensis]|uniref:LITAF domain-containing protein-like n=1 Tax=Liolophura sinensis TaxID=3198878 RepID=UPI0031583043